jgi:multiple sugar transport system permease protein
VVTSSIAVALVWQWIYNPDSGLLNQVLGVIGLPPQKWVNDPVLAMPAIVAMSIWQGLGINVIIFLAALQAIPSELLDAASVDGAGRWARFRSVIVPLLTPAIFFTGVLSLIDGFQVFDQVFVLVKPRPTDATITIVYFIYENGFKFFKMGLASAASWVLFLIIALFTAIYFWSQDRWVHYQ